MKKFLMIGIPVALGVILSLAGWMHGVSRLNTETARAETAEAKIAELEAQEPQVEYVYETVEVEVPGPERIVTVEVPVTPPACGRFVFGAKSAILALLDALGIYAEADGEYRQTTLSELTEIGRLLKSTDGEQLAAWGNECLDS